MGSRVDAPLGSALALGAAATVATATVAVASAAAASLALAAVARRARATPMNIVSTLRCAPAIHTARAGKLHKKAVAHEQRAQKHAEGGGNILPKKNNPHATR